MILTHNDAVHPDLELEVCPPVCGMSRVHSMADRITSINLATLAHRRTCYIGILAGVGCGHLLSTLPVALLFHVSETRESEILAVNG